MPENANKAVEGRVKKIIDARGDAQKAEELGFRGGRSWAQIADGFCTKILKDFERSGVASKTLTGREMRQMVGEPDNKTLRERCSIHGIRLKKDDYTNAYVVSKFSVVEKELKKRGQA